MILYFIKLFFALALMYTFYKLLLERLTFYQANRWYLLVYSIFCCWLAYAFIPADFSSGPYTNGYPSNPFYTLQVTAFVPARIFSKKIEGNRILYQWLGMIYITGTTLMIFRMVRQWSSFIQLKRKAAQIALHNGVPVYHIEKKIVPFCFGRSIYINRSLIADNEFEQIIRHEEVHAKQLHTIDVIWTELLITFNWFNPFAWLLRKAVRQNLEYIADEQLLKKGMEKKGYQYLLLKIMGADLSPIASGFNAAALKQRIIMMNVPKTTNRQLLRFLLLLPLTVIFLMSFRSFNAGIIIDEPKTSASTFRVSTALHYKDRMSGINQQFFKKNANIVLLYWKKGTTTLQVYLKDDMVENYDLSKNADVAIAETKYGRLPSPTPGSVSR